MYICLYNAKQLMQIQKKKKKIQKKKKTEGAAQESKDTEGLNVRVQQNYMYDLFSDAGKSKPV